MKIINPDTKLLINRHKLYNTFTFIATILWSIIGFSLVGLISYICFKLNFTFTVSSVSQLMSNYSSNVMYILLFSFLFVLVLGVVANICVLCTSGDIITFAEYKRLSYRPKAYRI